MGLVDDIKDRLDASIHRYEEKARRIRNIHQVITTTTIISLVILPPAILMLPKWVSVTVSLIAGMLYLLRSVYRFEDRWLGYRSTAELLRAEKEKFLTKLRRLREELKTDEYPDPLENDPYSRIFKMVESRSYYDIESLIKNISSRELTNWAELYYKALEKEALEKEAIEKEQTGSNPENPD